MNTYNENLRSTIVSSLLSQEVDQKKLGSQKNAALFTLYHAQGAEIIAAEKLEAAGKQAVFQATVRKQAVNSSNMANNQLASTTQASQYIRQSVTNAAVCAANVKVAANSILRLAGDIGNIFSILMAADQDSALYKSAEYIRDLINDTAYSAETASHTAMEASMYTSEVASATLLDQSKNTNGLVNNLLKSCSADFDATSQAAAAASRELDTAVVNRGLVEGNLQDIAVDLDAAQSVYRTMNERLNLDLNVDNPGETSFTVHFAPIVNAFEDRNMPLPVVQDYYIIVVKNSKKFTFSMATAAAILEEEESKRHILKIDISIPQGTCSQMVKFKEQVLKDADGDEICYGQPYVVFLLAAYTQAYKMALNDFSNYLSAPSNTFVLTILWPKVQITVKSAFVTTKKDKEQTGSIYALRFHIKQNPLCDCLPEYRCILLPATTGLSKPGFVFDLAIAQQVAPGNYTVAAYMDTKDMDDHYIAYIGGETTDNFGSPLTDQAEYYVLVLTTSSPTVENTAGFTDTLSDLGVHSKFQYQISDRS
ncbi:MAG: hypothetical protein JWR23_3389 [Mucilaginibacter sp.]|nr:hypothetical protein [Mucilaginibacter sp.]